MSRCPRENAHEAFAPATLCTAGCRMNSKVAASRATCSTRVRSTHHIQLLTPGLQDRRQLEKFCERASILSTAGVNHSWLRGSSTTDPAKCRRIAKKNASAAAEYPSVGGSCTRRQPNLLPRQHSLSHEFLEQRFCIDKPSGVGDRFGYLHRKSEHRRHGYPPTAHR